MKVALQSIGFRYPGQANVIRDLDLTIQSDSIHAIVGRNGCGKTTLLRLIAGLDQPNAGTVKLVGTRRRPNATALVFQTPRLIEWWNVGRNVGIGPEFSGAPEDTHHRIRDFFSAHVGLAGLTNRMPGTLSRGQQSRAGLGRALAHDADVLLMDEPFAHLDQPARRRIYTEIEAYWQATPRTIVLVTHDIEEAVLLSDRVSIMGSDPARILETIEVDAGRPRTSESLLEPGIRSATSRAWEALENAV